MKRERGVAIIMAILIVALATSVAAYAAWQQNLWLRQTENLVTQAQALAVARAAINFGRAVLHEDLKEDQKTQNGDNFQENWAKYTLAVPVEGGSVAGKITDQQGLFNVNNLAASDPRVQAFQKEAFLRLLQRLDLPSALADALEDWIDADTQGGMEDLAYLGKQPYPYRTANRALLDVEELARVQGFDEQTLQKLRPFVTALPVALQQQQQQGGQIVITVTPTPVNVNTAPKEVLEALFEGNGERVLRLREEKPFKNENDFKQRAKDVLGEAEGGQGDPNQAEQPQDQQGEQQEGDQPGESDDQQDGRRTAQQAAGEQSQQQPVPSSDRRQRQPTNPDDPQAKHRIQLGQQGDVDVKSYNFLVVANASFGRAQVSLAALIQRGGSAGAGAAPTTIVWQKQLAN